MMRKRNIIGSIFFLGILLITFSCKKNKTPENKVPEYSFNLEMDNGIPLEDTLQISPYGDSIDIIVKADILWTIEELNQQKWLDISPTSGKNNAIVNIKVDSNDTDKKRVEELIFKNDKDKLSSLIVSQNQIVDTSKEEEGTKEQTSFKPILDVGFKADGGAEDISPQHHTIASLLDFGVTTVYSESFGRYIARFNHKPGSPGKTNGFYRYDYSNDIPFRTALSNGFTLETEFMLNVPHPLPNVEMKMFSSHQGGGTGFLIGKEDRGHAIVFLPHIGGKYIWVNSGITPEQGKYYHVIGVWNKEEGKAYIYVDGVLKDTKFANGYFDFPSAGSNWFGIGADPSKSNGNTWWKGDVVLARVYDKPLNSEEVDSLWKKMAGIQPSKEELSFSNVELFPKKVVQKSDYVIHGKSFQTGDKIKIVPLPGTESTYLLDGIVSEDNITVEIPEGFTTGKYRLYVVRGGREIDIGFTKLTVVSSLPDLPKVIAHKGYWRSGTTGNSLAALAKAQELGAYGSEFDVHITKDGIVVVHHDAVINGINIEKVNYSEVKDMTLSNGEKLPTFAQFLHQEKKNTNTRLICEIKKHSGSTGGVDNNIRAAEKVVQMVQDSGLVNHVSYISFSIVACEKVHELLPNVSVAYLNGTLSPQQLSDKGLDMDYKYPVIQQHPNWVSDAHKLGMEVNVWTVDSKSDQLEMINLGVDYITTNYPQQLLNILKNY